MKRSRRAGLTDSFGLTFLIRMYHRKQLIGICRFGKFNFKLMETHWDFSVSFLFQKNFKLLLHIKVERDSIYLNKILNR